MSAMHTFVKWVWPPCSVTDDEWCSNSHPWSGSLERRSWHPGLFWSESFEAGKLFILQEQMSYKNICTPKSVLVLKALPYSLKGILVSSFLRVTIWRVCAISARPSLSIPFMSGLILKPGVMREQRSQSSEGMRPWLTSSCFLLVIFPLNSHTQHCSQAQKPCWAFQRKHACDTDLFRPGFKTSEWAVCINKGSQLKQGHVLICKLQGT